MSALGKVVAAHPLAKYKPYNAIKFARVDGNGTPLYTVAKEGSAMGAAAALGRAVELFGGKCFHCDDWMPPQKLSYQCTRDHLRPKKDGGSDYLHNLVISCGDCNKGKAAMQVVDFRRESAVKYLSALDEHLTRCLKQLTSER
jgi:5-methylcytosine-specific restriction endonuclease McrA